MTFQKSNVLANFRGMKGILPQCLNFAQLLLSMTTIFFIYSLVHKNSFFIFKVAGIMGTYWREQTGGRGKHLIANDIQETGTLPKNLKWALRNMESPVAQGKCKLYTLYNVKCHVTVHWQAAQLSSVQRNQCAREELYMKELWYLPWCKVVMTVVWKKYNKR